MPGKEVRVEFKVIRSERRITKDGNPYYVLELLDASGNKHEARVWNDVLSGRSEYLLPREDQYWGDVKSHETIFKGQKQLVIDDYWVLEPDKVHEAVKEQFVEQPVIDVDRVIDRMFDWTFWDRDLYLLMQRVREHLRQDGVWEKIRAIPAGASYHHSVRGGFLLHIDEMLSFAEGLCECRERALSVGEYVVEGLHHYPGLVDFQILRAAIVLHDIGKVYDYDEKTLQYQSNPISECLEHTIVGILMVERYWIKDSAESIDRGLRLMHALAAHHGTEMGAVKPKTPEAVILHHIDIMSANLDVCRRAYDDAKKTGAPSEYSKMMGVRPFVPGFFQPDTVTYPRNKEMDQKESDENVTEKIESESGSTEKLPWEE
jgi:3'-5' exoribonuclease